MGYYAVWFLFLYNISVPPRAEKGNSMEKSQLTLGANPDWYRVPTCTFGDYFGSLSSLSRNETYLTHDRMYIVHRDHGDNVTVRRNICTHAGALLLTNPGVQDVAVIKCPVHKWAFKPSGELIGAPHFRHSEDGNLHVVPFNEWNGYIFGNEQDEVEQGLASFGTDLGITPACFDPREFIFMGEEEYPLPYPRELMMVNYFDGYHVPLYHQKTFDAVADCSSYRWEFSSDYSDGRVQYSIQQVCARNDIHRHKKHLMERYVCDAEVLGWADLHTWLDDVMVGVDSPLSREVFALWASIYGNGYLMPELYEGGLLLAVSYLVSKDGIKSDTENVNLVEYYVHKCIPEEFRTMAARKFKHAYEQSAREDDEICLRLWEGHRQRSIPFQRIYHEVLEAGDLHYREWFMKHFMVK